MSKLIAVGSSDAIFVVDLENEANIIGKISMLCFVYNLTLFLNSELNADYDRVQSLNWSDSGSLLTASAKKGREGYIFDPRASSDPVQVSSYHGDLQNLNIYRLWFYIRVWDEKDEYSLQMKALYPQVSLMYVLFGQTNDSLLFFAESGSGSFII